MSLRILLVSLLAWLALVARADSPSENVEMVVAKVHTRDTARIQTLRERFDFWGYRWRDGVAVFAALEDRLPPDALIDAEATRRMQRLPAAAKGTGTIPGFPCYRTVEQTQADLAALAEAYPELASWEDYGDSWLKSEAQGGYDLMALVLGNRTVTEPRPVLMVLAAMHARELSTAEAATRFAEWLLAGYGEDPERSWLLDHTEIHVLAQHNPDGRKQAEAGLLWRKNVNQAYCGAGSSSRGADLNRNAATSFWGGPSSSGTACAETYRGPEPASEPETVALESWVAARFADYRDGNLNVGAPASTQGLFVSLHSFGEYVFYPWEGADLDTGNETGYRALSQRLAHATGYAACQNCCIGTASGTAVDQVYEAVGAASLTIELGSDFFESCASFENVVWPQARAALMLSARLARAPYAWPLGPDLTAVSVTVEAGGVVQVSATANDGLHAVNNPCAPVDPQVASQAVAGIRASVGDPPWSAGSPLELVPADGAFDESAESAGLVLPVGAVPDDGVSRLVYLVAEDSEGNAGPPRAALVTVGPMFMDGFEPGTSRQAGPDRDF